VREEERAAARRERGKGREREERRPTSRKKNRYKMTS
jgi:hypothetical protein